MIREWVQRKKIDGRDASTNSGKRIGISKEDQVCKRLKASGDESTMPEDDFSTDLDIGSQDSVFEDKCADILPSGAFAIGKTPILMEKRLETKKMVGCIKDSVHGCIYLEPLCMAIIDTIQFQRLRHLKQLGASNYVYMTATHSRFEHSIGVGHLAEKLLVQLLKDQPWLPITEKDILCVKIAGHGPFSHVYDGIFMEQLRERNRMLSSMDGWTHEQGSLDLLDYLIESNNIDLEQFGLAPIDYIFIREMILGRPIESNQFCGRPHAQFLYQVVNNAKSGLDVDKLDYFLRDALYTGSKSACDTQLILSAARVLPDRETKELTICWPEKLVEQLMKVFRTRFELHQSVYQHKARKYTLKNHQKVSRAIEYMICDAFLEADAFLKIKDTRISQAPLDMKAYQSLDDRVLTQIECSMDPKLMKSQAILRRIAEKPLYKCVGKTHITSYSMTKSIAQIKREIASMAPQPLDISTLILEKNKVHYGEKERDPLENIRFFKKAATIDATCYKLNPQVYEMHCPRSFMELNLRLFVRDPLYATTAREAFEKWITRRNHSSLCPQES
ncbi:SAM domain and HD domain 1 [Thraustotheca clavata]|uniref:SAM domain and HD domain 1 n=1 Tax=Thraustotheca clavata TaxID=74557 RepID=A0A1W0AAE6_9STRA|nr:SAM domain and HD domain 1 [Thraustotheca clavata]